MRKLSILSIALGFIAWAVFMMLNFFIGSFIALCGIFSGYNALFKEAQTSRIFPWIGMILNGSVFLYLAWLVIFTSF